MPRTKHPPIVPGDRFGYYVVVSEQRIVKQRTVVDCECVCGSRRTYPTYQLRAGHDEVVWLPH